MTDRPTESSMSARSKATLYFFLLYAAAVLPLCFLGYGSDNDTYGILEAAKSTWQFHHPVTSRNPGYWLYEALEYAIGHRAGFLGTNFASMCAGAFILWRFLALCRKSGIPHKYFLAGCAASVPCFLIAASSTMDYLWSLAFLVLAAECLFDSRYLFACIVGAIAIGFRGSNALVLAGMYAGLLVYGLSANWDGQRFFRTILSGVAAAALGALFFLPSWEMSNHTFRFLTPGIGPAAMWTFKMHVGRLLYKPIYLFGPIATLALVWLVARSWKDRTPLQGNAKQLWMILLGGLLGNLILFAKFPVEVSYLLPGMVFFLLLAGISLLNTKTRVWIVLCGIISFNVISISFAEPNVPMHATNAKLTFKVRKGVLIEDIEARLKAKQCSTVSCWDESVGKQPEF